jgi:hypothetical protein
VWQSQLGDSRQAFLKAYRVKLKAKVQRFNADPEIQTLLNEIHGGKQTYGGLLNGYSSQNARKLKETTFEVEMLAGRGFHDEKLDQLTIELLHRFLFPASGECCFAHVRKPVYEL